MVLDEENELKSDIILKPEEVEYNSGDVADLSKTENVAGNTEFQSPKQLEILYYLQLEKLPEIRN